MWLQLKDQRIIVNKRTALGKIKIAISELEPEITFMDMSIRAHEAKFFLQQIPSLSAKDAGKLATFIERDREGRRIIVQANHSVAAGF